MAPRRQIWSVANLLTRFWEDGLVVFNLDSGNTHLLTPIAGQILQILMQGPADLQELSRRLTVERELQSDPELNASISEVIQQFEALGIVYPAHE